MQETPFLREPIELIHDWSMTWLLCVVLDKRLAGSLLFVGIVHRPKRQGCPLYPQEQKFSEAV